MAVELIPAQTWERRSDPEDGEQAIRMHHLFADQGERAILGFACEAGVIRNKGRKGAAKGPAAIRQALANMAAPDNAMPIADMGDISVTGDCLEEGQTALAKQVSAGLLKATRVLVLGGGHETAFGSYQGLSSAFPNARIGIINLDAHLDLRLVGENGPSSGTPFAQIRELAPEKFDYLCLGVAEEANTRALFERAENWGVQIVNDHSLIASPMASYRAIDAIVGRCDCIYLTIDIDLLPAYQAPGVSAPAARGVPLETVEHIITQIIEVCERSGTPIPVADIVELSPAYDRDFMTSRTAALLARRLLLS